jgi:hypothetical protein
MPENREPPRAFRGALAGGSGMDLTGSLRKYLTQTIQSYLSEVLENVTLEELGRWRHRQSHGFPREPP